MGRICGGYRIEGVNKVQSPTLDIVYDGLQDRQPWRQANYHAREHGLSRDVLPPDWEFIEGFRYCTFVSSYMYLNSALQGRVC